MKIKKNYNNDDILVSIAVITYGHEKYIAQALDSILMQKVNFKYEIIVGEDCSPDKTREILKEYEKKYPDKFIMVYRDKNIGARKNSYDIDMRCRGKYIAYLEGDDYWIDCNKLQKQVDFLQENPEFIAVTHKVIVVDENNKIKNEKYPCCKDKIYTAKHYMKNLLPGQTASVVKRNYYKQIPIDYSILNDPEMEPGDRLHALIMVSLGKVFCMDEIMSAYRHITSGGTSFSAISKQKTKIEQLNYYNKLLKFNNEQLRNKNLEAFFEGRIIISAIKLYGIKEFKKIIEHWNKTNNKMKVLTFVLITIITWPYRKILSIINKSKYGF